MTTVKLVLSNETKEITLPWFLGSIVSMKTKLTVGEQRKLLAEFPNASDASSPDASGFTMAMLIMSIVSWNFVDANDVAIPVSMEAVDMLWMEDLTVLQETIVKQMEKKK